MSTEQARNAARLREAFAKWRDTKAADIDMWRDYATEDIEIFSLADGNDPLVFTKPRRGYADFHTYVKGLTDNFSMDSWEIDETIAEGDRVVGIGSTGWTNKATGKSFLTQVVMVTRWRDGKMYEYREYYDTAKIAATTQ